jgi:GNAT superfamily N-acetyltransferase
MERIIQGKEPDTLRMVESFSAAFADDPGLAWIWPDRADRLTRLPHFFAAIVGGTISNGVALRSVAYEAISLWRRPGRIMPTDQEMTPWRADMAKAFSSGAERSQLMSVTLKRHPPEGIRWWYLQFIGVRPEMQGTGFGGKVIRAGLELAAAEGLPVYVEVMNPDNLGYYNHVGFETVAEFDIPDFGPHVWAMLWRKP